MDFDLPPQLFRLAPTRRALGRLALACLLPLPALAQHVALQDRFVPPPGWRPPTVTAPQLGGGQPIQLREARVEVEVFGGQARTRIELRLFNPNPRVLEGELQFPLLDGQVVTGFALDVNGRLRDAVPVPKARGQEIFEDIRRRRVDPGLLEATAGNQYKLRVYPIGAQAERQVALTLVETLPRQGGASLVRVPLAFASSVGRLEVRVRADGLARSQTRLVQAPQGTEVTAGNQGAELHFSRAAWTAPEGPAGWLQWALQRVDQPQAMVGETGGQRFFAAQQPFADEAVRRPAPRHVALVWDASGSAASQARVLPVLDAYFRALNKPVKVSLIVLRNRAEAVRTFDVAPGGFGALAEALRAEPQDGSSNFDELPIPPDADATVLVTDGLATDGKRQIGYRHTAPVFALNGSPVADVPRLRRLAERTGGALVDATAGSAEEAARAMLFGGWRIEKLSSLSADQLVAPTLQLQQGRLAVAGRLQDTSARVDVVLAHPSGKRRTLALDIRRPPTAGGWPGQQWAAWRSAELADEPALHQTALERIAVEHGIVGPNSALIVLEQAADYARYELPAPADLAAEVAQLRGHLQAQAAQARTQHIEAMVRQFEARQRWWERDFPKDAPKAAEISAQVSGAIGGMTGVGGTGNLVQRRARAEAGPAAAPSTSAPDFAPAPAVAAAPPAPAQDSARMAKSGAGGNAAAPAKSTASTAGTSNTIALQAWTPDTPYLRRLQAARAEDLYRIYLDERRAYRDSSAFYLDVAGLFFERGQEALGLRILSNLAEMNLQNRQLLRLYAYRLTQARQPALAVPVFERVAELAPNEPQSWRDLGLAFADSARPQQAVDALWEVVARPWNGRFAGVNMIALAELNAIAAQAQSDGPALDLHRVDTRLRRNLPLALRVVLAWDSDDTDIDLWVDDPNAERAMYSRRLTAQGGAMSPDATGGYGPEEFSLKSAKPGKYVVQAQFFGNRQQVLSAGTTVTVRVTTGFGTPQARDEWTSVRLTKGSEVARLAEIEVK